MTSASPRWVVVDDIDSNIQYSGPWFQDSGSQDNVGNFGPAYRSTLHGTKSNASFSYSFSGTQVQIFGSNNLRNDSGVLDPSWECFIDHIRIPPTPPFQFAENNWLFCNQDQLVDGPHIITVNATVQKAQTFWFDSLHYIPSPSLPLNQAAVLIDSLDSALQFGAGWGALGGGANTTGQTGSIFTFDFIGVSLSWYSFIPQEFPRAATTGSYTIDGGAPTNFLLKGLPATAGTTIYNQKFFETTTLPAGHHQIVVTYLGNSQTTPLTLDYLIVQNGTIPSSNTTSGTSSSGDATSPSKKPNNTAAIAGGIIGGLVLIAIAVAAYIYLRRREKKLNEKADLVESRDAFVEPFHYTPVQTSFPQNTNPTPATFIYPGHKPQLSHSTNPTHTHHGSMPSFTSTDLQSAILPPSSTSGTDYPSNANTHGNYPGSSQSNQGYFPATTPTTVPYPPTPMSDKARREAEATAAILRSQRSQQPLTPNFSDDSSSRVVMHEDSGIRMPSTGQHVNVVEVPPMYTDT